MKPTIGVNTILVLCAAVAGGGHAPASLAQNPVIEEIVVTARKRAESLQDVPVTVKAFSESAIRDAGIDQVADFLALTPNVSFANSEAAGVNFMTIRGLSQVRNGESPVAVVIDGVLMTDPGQFDQELFDIRQIEVLKGPQGALYGRNAIGGAINITSKPAAEEFEARMVLGTGNGGRRKLQGVVSGPGGENVNFRLAGSFVDWDGHIDNIFLNEEADPHEEQSFRAKLNWRIADGLTADFRISRSETKGGSLNFVVNADYNNLDFLGDADDTSVPIAANRIGVNDREITNYSLKSELDLPIGRLISVTAYDDQEEFYAASAFPYECNPGCEVSRDRTPISHFLGLGPQLVKVFNDVEAWSQELRLTSADDQALRWIAGAYYLRTDRYRGLPTERDIGQAPDRGVFTPLTLFGFADDNDYESYALFGQINYDLAPEWELSLALRYDDDTREQTDVAPSTFSATSGTKRRKSFAELQPKFTVRYQPADNMNVFALWSRGFRSGGFNQNGIGAAASAAGIQGISDEYDKEVSSNIELGWKSTWLDDRLRLDGGLFYTEVEDQHFFQFIGAINAQLLNNIDDVSLAGGEIELQYAVAEGFDIYASYGYLDSEIEDYTVEPGDEGNWAPYVPEQTFNAGFQYTVPVSGGLEAQLRLDYEHRGKQYWDTGNTTARDALDLVNGRAGIRGADGRWSVFVWGQNLTDEEYNAEFVRGGFASIARPRTYGVDLTLNF